GLNFVTRANVSHYLTTTSRFEGSTSRERFPVGRRRPQTDLNYSTRRVGLPGSFPDGGGKSVRKFSKKTFAMLGIFAAIAAVAASGAAASHKASVQVCVLLPDTKSSVRWVQFDAPDLKAAFKK